MDALNGLRGGAAAPAAANLSLDELEARNIQAWNEAEGAVIGLFHVTC